MTKNKKVISDHEFILGDLSFQIDRDGAMVTPELVKECEELLELLKDVSE
jgi:hypothetical protein